MKLRYIIGPRVQDRRIFVPSPRDRRVSFSFSSFVFFLFFYLSNNTIRRSLCQSRRACALAPSYDARTDISFLFFHLHYLIYITETNHPGGGWKTRVTPIGMRVRVNEELGAFLRPVRRLCYRFFCVCFLSFCLFSAPSLTSLFYCVFSACLWFIIYTYFFFFFFFGIHITLFRSFVETERTNPVQRLRLHNSAGFASSMVNTSGYVFAHANSEGSPKTDL